MDLTHSLAPHAAALRSLVPLVTADAVRAATVTIQKSKNASDAAWDTAWNTAWGAAGNTVWNTAWDAAMAATGAAGGMAAGSASGATAITAAWDAAWDAARASARAGAGAGAAAASAEMGDAAMAALETTVSALEVSALDLTDRMLAVTPESLEETSNG